MTPASRRPQVLKQALTKDKDQVLFAPAGGVLYIALNTTVKPFDNINVRKAIIAPPTAPRCA